MKKKMVVLLTGAMTVSMFLSGCAASKGLETDELKISQYKGVEVDEVEKPEEITDEDVENAVTANLQANAEVKDVTDRPVQEGDTATIDFVGKMDGVEFEGGSGTDYPLAIGSGQFIEGFEDSVIGHNIGDTYDWEGSFPEDYQNTDVAGKPVTFTITVKSVTEQVLPELNDEFVKKVSKESKTVKEYKKEVKKSLEKDAKTMYEDSLGQEVWQTVLDNTEVTKYPSKEIEKISGDLIDQYKSAAEFYGSDYETFIQDQMNTTVEDFEKQVDEAAKSSVKQTMVTEAIAEKEKIKLDDKTYNSELKQMAKDYGYADVDELKKAVKEEDLKDIILNNKVKEWLIDNCVQVKSEK